MDAAKLPADLYDPAAMRALRGQAGRIALEVHDNDPLLGEDRWGRDTACRWRNIRLRPL